MSGINLQGETEQSLVEALQQGRQEVLSLLYDAYAPVMMGVISGIVQDAEVAEEVLQETFVAIWSRIGIYDSSRNRFLTWGLAIARGVALEAKKNGKYKLKPKKENNSIATGSTDTNGRLHLEMNGPDNTCCSLRPQEKAILDLIYLKGRSRSEAAIELGITEKALLESLKQAFLHLKGEKSS